MAKSFLIFSCILVYVSLSTFAEGLTFFGFGSDKIAREEDPTDIIRGLPYNKQCKKKPENGRMTNLEITPCEGDGQCNLVKGTNVTLKLEFVTFKKSQKLFGKLFGVMNFLWGASVPFGDPENLCLSPQIDCPAVPDQVYKYERTIFVKNYYPQSKLDVMISVEGDDGLIACVLVPVEIVKSSKTEKRVPQLETESSYSWF